MAEWVEVTDPQEGDVLVCPALGQVARVAHRGPFTLLLRSADGWLEPYNLTDFAPTWGEALGYWRQATQVERESFLARLDGRLV
jgi:hypothetical protein